jgi:hypothetical protein
MHTVAALSRAYNLRKGVKIMATEEILGIDIHDAIMRLRRAIENDRLRVNSPITVRALEKVSFGADGRIDPVTVGPEVRALARGYIGAHPDDWATR